MKDLLVGIIDSFFENISNKDDYTLKDVLVLILRIVIFLLILVVVLYFLLSDKQTVIISD